MVLKLFTLLILSSLLINDHSPSLYESNKKRVNKILNNHWEDHKFSLTHLHLDTNELPELYRVSANDSDTLAYVWFDEAPGKIDNFNYMVIFDSTGKIEKVSILVYRENYGGEISSKRFLKQFIGKENGEDMEYPSDIDGISGATISVQSITMALKKNSIEFQEIIGLIK
ncbi:MAG: FMN-binding protein [Bacteroidota bacterium]